MTKKEHAEEMFHGGFNCATSVLVSFCEEYDLEPETAAKLACGLGGGCGVGDICGAVSGAVLVVGLKHGQYILEDSGAKRNCYAKTSQFIGSFKDRYGALTCRDLLRSGVTAEDDKEAELQKRSFCSGLVGSCVEILEELGY